MANCKICVKFDDCPWRSDPDAQCSAFKRKPMTNGDRIRQMSDEELAEYLYSVENAPEYSVLGLQDLWLEWLRKVVEE